MRMYEGINVGMLTKYLKMDKKRDVIIYYEYETPDDDDFDTDMAIHTIADVVKDGEVIRIVSELDNGKRITAGELIKRLSEFNKKMPVKLVNDEQIINVFHGTDDDGFFCIVLENSAYY